jgi:hypothetical protein
MLVLRTKLGKNGKTSGGRGAGVPAMPGYAFSIQAG